MKEDQKLELETHLEKLDEDGNPFFVFGSIPWLLNEAMDNVFKIQDLMSRGDRLPKKELRPILMDLRDQIRELKKRLQ